MDEDRLKRHDLSDGKWARLKPLLPAHPRQDRVPVAGPAGAVRELEDRL